MRRDISCEEDAGWWRKQVGRYPDELVVMVPGRARQNYLCDMCGKTIPAGEKCFAVSVVKVPQKYVPWEREYLILEEHASAERN